MGDRHKDIIRGFNSTGNTCGVYDVWSADCMVEKITNEFIVLVNVYSFQRKFFEQISWRTTFLSCFWISQTNSQIRDA